MSEQQLRDVLSAYGESAQAPDQFAAITRALGRRRARGRRLRLAVGALALCFAFMTFAPVGGSALAAVRKEIQPTLFLKTDRATARETVREPLILPATFTDYGGVQTALTDDAQGFVVRWLSYEMVAVAVTSKPDAMGTIHFDLRRTTYKQEPGEVWWQEPANATAQEVKVGEHDGVLLMSGNLPVQIRWWTDTHMYRLTAPGCETAEQLIALAERIR